MARDGWLHKDILGPLDTRDVEIIEDWPREVVGEINYKRYTGLGVVAWKPGQYITGIELRTLNWN